MSDFAFGTYRVTVENPLHVEALREAMDAGIKLYDTSTNYMDGSAEKAIAKAMSYIEDTKRSQLEVVSKFGYIQGSNLLKHKAEAFEDVVEYSESCYHSIAPSFMRNQLTQSLQRLELNTLDCYLLHNPEYYLYDAIKKGVSRDEMLDTMYDRIYDVFVALELEVQEGRIKSYGISSNAFSKARDAQDFLPYEDLITLAQRAAKEAKSKKHSFTTLQLPINIIETEGLKCASWAKKNGLRVLSNRPLNALKESLMFRLAEYEEPKEYFHALNELLEIADNDTLKPLYNLIQQMDESRHKYGWIGDYDAFLYSQILPHVKKVIQNIDESILNELLRYIDNFLVEYRKMVAYECSKMSRVVLKEEFKQCDKKLQECAFEFLLNQKDIDYILVGMRKPSYVQEVLTLKS
ncbi:aldo/keto reductase [Sulfurimonas sp.]